MRNPSRINLVMNQLDIFWKNFPDLRFGQLVQLVEMKVKEAGKDPFYLEDAELKEILSKINAEFLRFKRI